MPETFEYWNDLALSDNYKDRFRSEYNILLILLEEQCVVMAQYLSILQKRAKLENILL